jgi:hypothetical protein
LLLQLIKTTNEIESVLWKALMIEA